MGASLVRSTRGHRLAGGGPTSDAVNCFLDHLEARSYFPATVLAYAFDLANFASFLIDRGLGLGDVRPSDLFAYLAWQRAARRPVTAKVVTIGKVQAVPATMNRWIASVGASSSMRSR